MNIPARRLKMGIVGVVLLAAIVLFLEVVVDHRRHMVPVVLVISMLMALYAYALSRKDAKMSGK